MMLFPLIVFILIINKRLFIKSVYGKISKIYILTVYLFLTIFYLFDFGFYSYTNDRINSTAMRFATDIKISLQVLVESYPVYKAILVIIILGVVVYRASSWIHSYFSKKQVVISKKIKAIYVVFTILTCAFFIYSSLTHYYLRWSQAFFSKNMAVNQFALNPVLYFYDSFAFRSEKIDMDEFKKYYNIIAEDLDLNKDKISYERTFTFDSIKASKKPNIVLVMLESVGVMGLGHYKNPSNSTPNLDSIIKTSLNFSNFYVTRPGTSSSIFSSITGLPDVEYIKTASRNPLITDQRIIFDQFDNYEKLYFIGGSANWANIRGVFQSNIKDLQIYEEGSYQVENRVDVWGIDDYDLFKEADKVLKKLHLNNKQFIAYIQTASNHMPFSVPDKKESYRPYLKSEFSKEKLKKSGFKSLESLNGLRYLDFNIAKFLERAKKSDYYDNTVFVFFGDHNVSMNKTEEFKNEFDLNIQVHHTPLIIHAPKLIEPKEISINCKIIDIFPTLANLLKINHTNYTLGRNILDSLNYKKQFSLLSTTMNGEPTIGIIKNNLYFYKTETTKKTYLYDLSAFPLKNIKNKYLNYSKKMDSLVTAYYHSTKYLYHNNKK